MQYIPSKRLSKPKLDSLVLRWIIAYLNSIIGAFEWGRHFVSITIFIIPKITKSEIEVRIKLITNILQVSKTSDGIPVILTTKINLAMISFFLFFHFLSHQIHNATKGGAIPKGIWSFNHFYALYLFWGNMSSNRIHPIRAGVHHLGPSIKLNIELLILRSPKRRVYGIITTFDQVKSIDIFKKIGHIFRLDNFLLRLTFECGKNWVCFSYSLYQNLIQLYRFFC